MKVSNTLFDMKSGDITGNIRFVFREIIEKLMLNLVLKPTLGYK